MERLILIFEIIGTISFALTGAMTGLKKQMDIFGVCVLGVTTAVGGGIIRDLILGLTPPSAFRDPTSVLIAIAVSIIVFFPAVRRIFYRNKWLYEHVLLLADSAGLGIFTVCGARVAMEAGDGANRFLVIFVAALEEMLTVARALQTPLEISHLKAIGRVNWRAAVPQMLAMMESAREDGVDVACDVYPYTAGSTQLIHVLPPECQTGGLEQLSERLGDAAFRAQLRERMQTGEDFENISLLAGWENIRIAALAGAEDQKYVGQSIAALAEKEGKDPFDALFDLLAREHCAVTMIDEIACEDDLEAILRDGHSSIISDSIYPGCGLCHPRVYGTFVRAIERYVCERGVLTLEEAVAKMTGLPAGRLGLRTKGKLIPGLDADILLFRPEALHERDSYADPAEFAEGMETVLVAGVPVLEDGAITGAKPGKILKR